MGYLVSATSMLQDFIELYNLEHDLTAGMMLYEYHH